MLDAVEWADLDGDLTAYPPLAVLFFRFDRPSTDDRREHVDDGGCGCWDCGVSLTNRRLDAAAYPDDPSRGTTVTTTDALSVRCGGDGRGIRGISSSSRSSPMAVVTTATASYYVSPMVR